MQSVVPETLMSILHAPFDTVLRQKLRWADLAMLKERYQEIPADTRVVTARTALHIARTTWSDQQVKDFIVTYFTQPPESAYYQTASADESRALLETITTSLFPVT